jgi:Zn-dependent protease with chaperone function
MKFLALGVCLTLGLFLVVNLLASLTTMLIWWLARRNLDHVSAESRAHGLFLLRALPALAGWVSALGVFLPSFCVLEPRGTSEVIPFTLCLFAVLGALVMGSGVAHAWRASETTSRVVAGWRRTAVPVELPGLELQAFSIRAGFPVVSVVGLFRPRLFISERVLAECPPEELSAMVRHERAHVDSRDNLKRLMFRLFAGPLSWCSAGREIERRWDEALEELADERGASASSALALARALVRVARMTNSSLAPMPLSLLSRGDGIERRVRRLLEGRPRENSRPVWLLATRMLVAAPAVLAVGVIADPRLLHAVHGLAEVMREVLP